MKEASEEQWEQWQNKTKDRKESEAKKEIFGEKMRKVCNRCVVEVGAERQR